MRRENRLAYKRSYQLKCKVLSWVLVTVPSQDQSLRKARFTPLDPRPFSNGSCTNSSCVLEISTSLFNDALHKPLGASRVEAGGARDNCIKPDPISL